MDSGKKKPDEIIFRDAMSDVTPMPEPGRIEPVRKMTPAKARQLEKDNRAVMKELLTPPEDPLEFETGEELLFLRSGQQQRVMRRLRRGYYSTADSIDLHHLNVATARQVLLDFLDYAMERQLGCVRIIHGKGLRSKNLPRIKMMTDHVLRRQPCVIAFASCRRVDGGTGATDVLLKTRRSRKR